MKKMLYAVFCTVVTVFIICTVSCKTAQNAQKKSPVESMPADSMSVDPMPVDPVPTESISVESATSAQSAEKAEQMQTDTVDTDEPTVELIPDTQQTEQALPQPTEQPELDIPEKKIPEQQPDTAIPAKDKAEQPTVSVQQTKPVQQTTPKSTTATKPAASVAPHSPTTAKDPLPTAKKLTPATTAPLAKAPPAAKTAPSAATGSQTRHGQQKLQTEKTKAEKPKTTADSKTAQSDIQSKAADAEADTNEQVSEQKEPVIVPSRSVSAKINQFIDIVYPGKGWIYLGEVKAVKPPVISFSKRVRDNENTLFSLQAKRAGTTLLHFYKQDSLAASYLDDYVEVTVLNENGTARDHVRLEAEPIPEVNLSGMSSNVGSVDLNAAGASSTGDSNMTSGTGGTNTASGAGGAASDQNGMVNTASSNGTANMGSDAMDADALYEKAEKAYNEKRYADALQALDEFFKIAEKNIDRALFLQGKIYESNSEFKNIRKALEVYEKLSAAFPDSDLWESARKRVIYIKRFYLDIR